MTDGGRIGFLIKGIYDPQKKYDFLDVVFYEGCSYVAKRKVIGISPVYSSDDWQIFANGTMQVDDALKFDSSNPVSNSAITTAIDGMITKDVFAAMSDVKVFGVIYDSSKYGEDVHVSNPYFPGWIPSSRDVILLRNDSSDYIRTEKLLVQGVTYYSGVVQRLSGDKVVLTIPPFTAVLVAIEPVTRTFYFNTELFDSELLSDSHNGVQNKVIFKRFSDVDIAMKLKADNSDIKDIEDQIEELKKTIPTWSTLTMSCIWDEDGNNIEGCSQVGGTSTYTKSNGSFSQSIVGNISNVSGMIKAPSYQKIIKYDNYNPLVVTSGMFYWESLVRMLGNRPPVGMEYGIFVEDKVPYKNLSESATKYFKFQIRKINEVPLDRAEITIFARSELAKADSNLYLFDKTTVTDRIIK